MLSEHERKYNRISIHNGKCTVCLPEEKKLIGGAILSKSFGVD